MKDETNTNESARDRPAAAGSEWVHRRTKMPERTDLIVAGSWRDDEWSVSSVGLGWEAWIDKDRTHWCKLPEPPSHD